jgi:hypothetical protein
MASSMTVASTSSGVVFGNKQVRWGTGNLGTYAADGIAVTAAQVGLSSIDMLVPFPSGGYTLDWVQSTGKIRAYQGGGQSAHTHDFKVIGSQAAAGTDALSAKVLTLGKEAATDITIAGANSATLGGVVATTATVAASAEVGAVDISATTFNWIAWGN